MAIKNYTTKVSTFQTLGEIQGTLAEHGARKVMIDYDNSGNAIGITFGLEVQGAMTAFQLKANIEGVLLVFKKQRLKEDREQAARTAWRNVKDWITAQMAFIECGNATMDEIFLPYLMGSNNKTLYECFSSGQIALPSSNGWEV